MDRAFLRDALRLRGITCFIQRCFGMGMQLVHHQTQFFHMGIMLINKFADNVCPLYWCSLRSPFGLPLASAWVKSHQNICGPMALRRSVIAQRLPGLSRERSTDCTNELGRHCIYTHWGTLRIIRLFLNSSDGFHGTDKGGIVRWWHTPFLLLPWCKCLFLQVRRTVACDTASTISHATIFAASMRNVHRSCPSGA